MLSILEVALTDLFRSIKLLSMSLEDITMVSEEFDRLSQDKSFSYKMREKFKDWYDPYLEE